MILKCSVCKAYLGRTLGDKGDDNRIDYSLCAACRENAEEAIKETMEERRDLDRFYNSVLDRG